MNGWTVDLAPAARRELRELSPGPRRAALELMAELREDPIQVEAIELRKNPTYWRARFYGHYRMIYRILRARKLVRVARIRIRDEETYSGFDRWNPS